MQVLYKKGRKWTKGQKHLEVSFGLTFAERGKRTLLH